MVASRKNDKKSDYGVPLGKETQTPNKQLTKNNSSSTIVKRPRGRPSLNRNHKHSTIVKRKRGRPPVRKENLKKNPHLYPFEENWTLESVKVYIDTLMELTICDNVAELKNLIIFEFVWKEMETKLKRNYELLKNFWIYRLHQQLFCPQPIYMSDIKLKMIEYLYENRHSEQTEKIKWHNVAVLFDGCTCDFLRRICTNLMRITEDATKSSNQLTRIEYLYSKYYHIIIAEKKDKFLPRLKYSKDKLELIDSVH